MAARTAARSTSRSSREATQRSSRTSRGWQLLPAGLSLQTLCKVFNTFKASWLGGSRSLGACVGVLCVHCCTWHDCASSRWWLLAYRHATDAPQCACLCAASAALQRAVSRLVRLCHLMANLCQECTSSAGSAIAQQQPLVHWPAVIVSPDCGNK
jgi:hypothetical protein